MTHEELWLKERPKLESKLRRRLSREHVEDVVDEAFVRLKRADAAPGQLWETAFRVEQELLTGWARETIKEEQAGLLTGVSILTIDIAILRADFDRAFRQLPRTQQEAFALIELRGLTHDEAAAVLRVPRTTLSWRCEAARIFLREELS